MANRWAGREIRRRSGAILSLAAMLLLAAFNSFGAMPGQHPKAPKTEAMFPHMDAALGLLRAAQQQLEKGEPVFHGHRIKAIAHVKDAISDLQKGINEYMMTHPSAARNEAIPAAPPSDAGDRYPHMSGALKLLQQAETHLNEAAKRYHGMRVEGLDQTKAAIAEIRVGMKEAAAHPEKRK